MPPLACLNLAVGLDPAVLTVLNARLANERVAPVATAFDVVNPLLHRHWIQRKKWERWNFSFASMGWGGARPV